jgi:hypothetical protein
MGTGSAPEELGPFWEMPAAATVAARIMLPINKRNDFFMMYPPIKDSNLELSVASYLDATIAP